MRSEKLEHKGYTEWHNARITHPKLKMTRYFGRWQYIIKNYWAKMSVVNLQVGSLTKDTFMWEVARLHWGKHLAMYWQRFKSTRIYFKYEDWKNRNVPEEDMKFRNMLREGRRLFARRPIAVEVISRHRSKEAAMEAAKDELRFWHMLWRTFVWRP